MAKSAAKLQNGEKKLVSNFEFVAYMAGIFFFTNMANVYGNNARQKYLSGLGLDGETVGLINIIVGVIGYVLPFFLSMVVDRAPKPGKAKFLPWVKRMVVPCGVLSVLLFYTPAGLTLSSKLSVVLMVIYQCVVMVLFNASFFFANTINQVAVVISPNHAERDQILSFRGISSAIASAAPLLWIMLLGLVVKGEASVFLLTSLLCSMVGCVAVLLVTRITKERILYSSQRQNPLLGYRDIIKNKHALLLLLSEFFKNFRSIAGFMNFFLAEVLLGKGENYMILGLPTAIGTFTGMLLVNALLKKFNSKLIYMASGVYSVVINALAFGAGVLSFQHAGQMVYTVIFVFFLFLTGIQYGASNLLPNMFKADILEELEAKTHKRLEVSLDFVVSLGSNLSGTIATGLAPMFLYGATALNFIQYKPLVNGVVQAQSERTKILILLVYTMGQGVFMLLDILPFFFYKLTGARKQQVHEEVLAYRAQLEAQNAAE